MRSPLLAFAVTASALPGLWACSFLEAPPDDAIVLCATEDDCPGELACNLATHVCTTPALASDRTAPRLVSASATPAFARDADTIIVTVVADEPLSSAALVLAPGTVDPGFEQQLAEDTATFSVVVASDTPAGTTVADAVVLRDAAGNERTVPLDDVSWRVDRTQPKLVRLEVVPTGPAGVVADLAPHTGVDVLVDVDEPLAGVTARFGASAGDGVPCAERAGVSLGFRCALEVAPGALSNGDNDVIVDAVDRAGNPATGSARIFVDTNAPVAVTGTERALLFDADGDLVSVLVPGGRLEVDFVVSEPLAGPPTVSLVVGAGPSAETQTLTTSVTGTQVHAELTSAQLTTQDDAHVHVSLEDPVGHAASFILALAPPLDVGIPVVAQQPSPCPHPAPGACPDADGDGALGDDDDCTLPPGADADALDDDPTVFPGALEIPGDGVDNDGFNGDSAIDEVDWVFVSCPDQGFDCVDGTDEGFAGTRAEPHRDLAIALAHAKDTGRGVIADGSFRYAAGSIDFLIADVPIIGGISRALGWQRVPIVDQVPVTYVTSVVLATVVLVGGSADVAAFDAEFILAPGATAVRLSVESITLADSTHLVASTFSHHASVDAAAEDVVITGGVFPDLRINQLARVQVSHARALGSFIAGPGAELVLVGTEGAIASEGGTVRGAFVRASTDSVPRALSVRDGEISLVNSVVEAAGGLTLLAVCDTECGELPRWSLQNTQLIVRAGAKALTVDGVDTGQGGAALAACTALGCINADAVEVLSLPGTGVLVGTNPFGDDALPSAVRTRDGTCRPALDGSWQVGPD